MAKKKSTKPPKLEVVKPHKPEAPIDLLKTPPTKVYFPKELPPPEGISAIEATAYVILSFISGSIFTMFIKQILSE